MLFKILLVFLFSILSCNLTCTAGLQSLSCGNNAITELPASIQSLAQALVALCSTVSFTQIMGIWLQFGRKVSCHSLSTWASGIGIVCLAGLPPKAYAFEQQTKCPQQSLSGHFLNLQRKKRSSDAEDLSQLRDWSLSSAHLKRIWSVGEVGELRLF